MKIWLILFSVYLLGLNFVPCADEISSQQSQETVVSEMEMQQDETEHSQHNMFDDCSPFCHCHCCHVHVTKFQPIDFETLTLNTPKKEFSQIQRFQNGYPSSLLDPPRV